MPYIGKHYKTIKSGLSLTQQAKVVDTMTGNGSATTLSLSTSPGTVNNVRIWIDGVFQTPGTEYTLSGSTITFTTAPFNGAVVLAISGATINISKTIGHEKPFSISKLANSAVTNDKITALASSKLTGTLPAISGANLTSLPAGNLTGTVADARISTLTASKLSGALPAIDGSNLTNLPTTVGFDTKNSSDPAITTNPSGGVGHLWVNTTSGEVFTCTDATSNENIWTNWGAGTGDVEPYVLGGTQQGFCSGGYQSHSVGRINILERYSFAASGNAADYADLTRTQDACIGTHSGTYGYTSGGESPKVDVIDKFPFASAANATDVGNLTVARAKGAGNSSESNGYVSGGENSGNSNVIDKHSFSSNGNATDVGDLTVPRAYTSGSGSADNGYSSGGTTGSVNDTIDKFSYASNNNATDVGNLIAAINATAGHSSSSHGYVSGGYTTTTVNMIQKFTFASNNNSTDVGNITVLRSNMSGTSHTTHGYTQGGYAGGPYYDVIDRFSFSSDGDSADVGNLTGLKFNTAGHSY